MRKKFFIFNPKSYLTGEALYQLAAVAQKVAEQSKIDVYMTAPYADLATIHRIAPTVITTAQHIDNIENGRGMGAVLPSSVYYAGVRATFLNHAEKPLLFSELVATIKKTKQIGIETIVCVSSLEEAKAIAMLEPDIILCEPTELIGTGQTSSNEYILQTNQIIKSISPSTRIMQAAGIMTVDDVERVIKMGADGTGCTSGIIKAENSAKMLEDMIKAVECASEEC